MDCYTEEEESLCCCSVDNREADSISKTATSSIFSEEEDEVEILRLNELRLNSLRGSYLSVLSDHQKPIDDGESYMTPEELEPYRMIGDSAMDLVFSLMQDEGRKLGPTDDFLKLAEEAKHSSQKTPSQEAMKSFMETYQTLPSWAEPEQLRRGQEVFLAYSPAAALALFYRSLVPGFASPQISAVIKSTAYLTPPARPDQSLQRLLDTGELLAACMGLGVDSLLPGGIGWKTAIHVRVLHAKVRFSLLQRNGKRKWDIEKYGIPINQEDMAATLLAFSVNVITGIDLVSGSSLCDQEKLDYLALWRYIGWLLGVETVTDTRLDNTQQPNTSELPPLDPCGSPSISLSSDSKQQFSNPIRKSFALLQSFVNHLGDPDESSVKIAHHLLQVTNRTPPKGLKDTKAFYRNDLFYYRCLQCRKFIGDPLADALQLPLHPVPWKRFLLRIASTVAMGMFCIYTRIALHIPICRRLLVRFHGYYMVKFHDLWSNVHKTKMEQLLETRQRMFNLVGIGSAKNGKTGGADSSNSRRNASMCPFAMIAEPIE